MNRERLDTYDARPKAMSNYLSNYGWHFNKHMCMFALEHLPKEISILDKDKVDSLLKTYGIKLNHNQLYDYIYVINYGMAMYFNSSIQNEKSLVLYLKDTIENSEEGLVFTKWYAEMCKLGIPIEWEDML